MPIHDYKCEKCGTVKEKIVKFSDEGKTFECVNDKCDGTMSKTGIPTGTRAILKGRFH